jgi:O-antigen ligase
MIPTSLFLWGGTRPWTSELIGRLLLADTAVFATALLILRRQPRVPRLALWAVVFLLAQGWLLTWNAHQGPGGLRILLPKIPSQLPFLPAFVDRNISMNAMFLISGLLGSFVISSDLAMNRVWLMRIWKTLAITGIAVVALGLAQRFTKAPAIYWNPHEYAGGFFFSVFRYHGNAGACINLLMPLMAGLAVLAVLESWGALECILWIVGTLATMAAAFVNVSRAAMVITGVLILAGFSIGWKAWSRSHGPEQRGHALVFGVVLLSLLAAMTLSFGLEKTLPRWKNPGRLWENGRLVTDRAIVSHLLPRTGFFGSGPGSFEEVFSATVESGDLPVVGRWDLAHNDYLQTLAEWGAVGFVCWAILLGGALRNGISLAANRRPAPLFILGSSASLSLAGVFLHAAVDFPLQIASLQLIVFLIAGMLWGSPSDGRKAA